MSTNDTKVGAYVDDELKMEMATFADGSRIIPRITTQHNKKYVVWKDNGNSNYINYPNKLLELYNNSSLHHTIIDMKAEQIAGGGLQVVDETHPKAKITQKFIDRINQNGDNLNDINEKIALELTLFNGFSNQLVYKKDWSIINEVIHIEYNKIRIETPDDFGKSFGYYYAFDWSGYRPTTKQYIPSYNYDSVKANYSEYREIYDRIIENNDKEDVEKLNNFVASGNTQLFVYKKYQPNSHYYPIPDYVATIPSLETDILTDIYASSSLANGMDAGLVITMLGEASDPETRKSAKRIMKSYSGARKAGKPMIIFANNYDNAPKVESVASNTNLSQKYKTFNDSVQQKILSGHRIPSSSLVGIQVAGKLGNSDDSVNSQEVFFTQYIKPRQKIIERYWNKIMQDNDLAKIEIINTNVFNSNAIESKDNNIDIEEKE